MGANHHRLSCACACAASCQPSQVAGMAAHARISPGGDLPRRQARAQNQAQSGQPQVDDRHQGRQESEQGEVRCAGHRPQIILDLGEPLLKLREDVKENDKRDHGDDSEVDGLRGRGSPGDGRLTVIRPHGTSVPGHQCPPFLPGEPAESCRSPVQAIVAGSPQWFSSIINFRGLRSPESPPVPVRTYPVPIRRHEAMIIPTCFPWRRPCRSPPTPGGPAQPCDALPCI